MATIINISSITQYYNSNKVVKTGTSTGSGRTQLASQNNAKSNAQSAAINAGVGGGTPPDGGSSSSTALFGSTYGSKATSIGTPTAGALDETSYKSSCSWTATRTSTMYQVKLKFTLPSGVAANKIASATLAFTGTSSNTNAKTFRVCAPSTTEQTSFQKYSTATSFSTSVGVNFNSVAKTTAETYSFSIIDVFKQCITNSQGWITLLIPLDTVEEAYPTITISGTPTISYELNYTYCTAPTSVTAGATIQKPGGTVAISWSGASGGTNNAISSYILYYNAGSAPTENSSQVSVTTTSYNFTIPSNASRTSTYYFKVKTIGSAGYNSGLSTAQATVKVNQLPSAPTVSVSPTRIKSTESPTVTFTATAGAANDTGQTTSVYYAASLTGTKIPYTSPLKLTLSATTTYYFWTSDGLEYSSAASGTVIKNIKPTISSVGMTAVATYSPTITIQGSEKSYVKNITGSVTASSSTGSINKYYWKLQVWTRTSTSAAPVWSGGTNIGNYTTVSTLSSTDVTKYGATFNTAYRLAVIAEDDIGEKSTEAYSGTIFGIPPAPTVNTIYNQKANSNRGGNTNSSHFEDGIRITYNNTPENTGVTRTLSYYNGSTWTSITRSGGTSLYDDLTLSSLSSFPRGNNYTFRVVFSCNNATYIYTSGSYMRANDIEPTEITITPASGSGNVIKPYTQNNFTFSFCHKQDLVAWKPAQDVANYSESGANPSNIYTVKLTSSVTGSTPIVCSMNSNTSLKVPTGKTKHYVTGQITLDNITTNQWIDLLKTSVAPNKPPTNQKYYTITLEITAVNGFGKTFKGETTFNADFQEGFIANSGSLVLKIKTGSGSSDFTNIPTGTYNSSNRYPLFPTQTIRFTVSDLRCYANQNFTIEARDTDANGALLGTVKGDANDWEFLSGSNRIYKLKDSSSKSIDYFITSITATTDKTFCMKIILDNGYTKTDLTSSICKYRRIQTSSIKPRIIAVSESEPSSNIFTFTYQITDYGGDNIVESGFSAASKQGGYSAITGQFFKCPSAGGAYSAVGSDTIDLKGKDTRNWPYSVEDTNDPLSNDIIYFGIKLTLTVAFVKIEGLTPTGQTTYPLEIYKNLYTYYRDTPNLLYGKNFFCLNQNAPQAHNNQLLEISAARYTSDGGTQVTRDTIYFGTDGTKFRIDSSNGLVIDCGSW